MNNTEKNAAVQWASLPKRNIRLMDRYGKDLFGHEEGKALLIDFLNAVFFDRPSLAVRERIVSVELLDKEPPGRHIDEKQYRMDLVCMTDKGTIINVEFQTYVDEDMGIRMFDYIVKLASMRKTSGVRYKDTSAVAMVMLTNKSVAKMLSGGTVQDDGKSHMIFRSLSADNPKLALTDKFEAHFIEVQKCPKIHVREMTRLQQWMAFFSQSHDAEFAELNDPIFNKAKEIEHMFLKYEDLVAISKERAERDEISRIGRSYDKGHAEGRAEGEVIGAEKNKRSTALKMLKDGLGLDVISRYTGLSQNELLAIKPV